MSNVQTVEGYLYDYPAIFEITSEPYPAEPYSWGGSRGTDYDLTVRLISYDQEGVIKTRVDAVREHGEADIKRQEFQLDS